MGCQRRRLNPSLIVASFTSLLCKRNSRAPSSGHTWKCSLGMVTVVRSGTLTLVECNCCIRTRIHSLTHFLLPHLLPDATAMTPSFRLSHRLRQGTAIPPLTAMDELCFKGYKAHVPPKWAMFADSGTSNVQGTSSNATQADQRPRSASPPLTRFTHPAPRSNSSMASVGSKSQYSFAPQLKNVPVSGINSTTLSGAPHHVAGVGDSTAKKVPQEKFRENTQLSKLVSSKDRTVHGSKDIHFAKFLFGPEKRLGLEALVHDSSDEDSDEGAGSYKKVRLSTKMARQLKADNRRQAKQNKLDGKDNRKARGSDTGEESENTDLHIPKRKTTWIEEMSAYCAKQRVHADAKARTLRLEQELKRKQYDAARSREQLLDKYAVIPPSLVERYRALNTATSNPTRSPTQLGGKDNDSDEEAEEEVDDVGNRSWRERARERADRQAKNAQVDEQQRRWYQSLLCTAQETEAALVRDRLLQHYESRQAAKDARAQRHYEKVLKRGTRAKQQREYEASLAGQSHQEHIEECRKRAADKQAEFISGVVQSHKRAEKRFEQQSLRKQEADQQRAKKMAEEAERQRARYEQSNANLQARKEALDVEARTKIVDAADRQFEKKLREEEAVLANHIGEKLVRAEHRRAEQRQKQLAVVEATVARREQSVVKSKRMVEGHMAEIVNAQYQTSLRVQENQQRLEAERIAKANAILQRVHSPAPTRHAVDESLVAEDLVAHLERKREIDDDLSAFRDEKLARIREKEDAHMKRQEELRAEQLIKSQLKADEHHSKCEKALQNRIHKEMSTLAKSEVDEAALNSRVVEMRRYQQREFDRGAEERAKKTQEALNTVNVKKRRELVERLNIRAQEHLGRIQKQNETINGEKRRKNEEKLQRAREMRAMVEAASEDRSSKYAQLLDEKRERGELAEWRRAEMREQELRRLEEAAEAQRNKSEQERLRRKEQFETGVARMQAKDTKVEQAVQNHRLSRKLELTYAGNLKAERIHKAQEASSKLLAEKTRKTQALIEDALSRPRLVAVSPSVLRRGRDSPLGSPTHHNAVRPEY